MISTLYASFEEPRDADRATGALMDHGLRPEDISLIANVNDAAEWRAQHERETIAGYEDLSGREPRNEREAVTELGVHDARVAEGQTYAEERPELHGKTGITTTTGSDAGSGAAKGAAVGLGVGILAALAAVFVPGIGLVVGGGALATALAGTAGAVGAGAIAGGAFGYMKDQGVPDEEIAVFRENYDRGGAILVISIPQDKNRWDIENILAKYNALNVRTHGPAHMA